MGRREDVIEAYEAWDPDEESSTQLAGRLGISKARLYQILDKEGITPKARRTGEPSISYLSIAAREYDEDRGAIDPVTQHVLKSLLDELEALRNEVARYREKYGPLP